MWDHLIPQTVITLNHLRQSNLHPHLSAWEHYNGLLNYDAMPMGPLGCKVLIHEPTNKRTSWGFHATPGYYIGPALNHYRSFKVFPSKTRSPRISDIVEFQHSHITVPEVSPEDKVIDTITKLKRELASIPSPNDSNQMKAI